MTTPMEKEKQLDELREKVIQETLRSEWKNSYGLFSVPPAGMSGSASDILIKKKNLGTDGKVITLPRGIYPGSPKTGRIESSFFSKVAYISIGDPYVDPDKRSRHDEIEKKKLMKHDAQWKSPKGATSDPTTSPYKNMSDYIEKKKPTRDTNGKVITENRNIFTTIPHPGYGSSTIGHLFSKPDRYISDPYERRKELERKEKQEAKKKLQEQPFLSQTVPKDTFASNKETFALKKPLPEQQAKAEPKDLKIHEGAFKPANPGKKGCNATFGKYPEHKGDPVKPIERKREDSSNKKESFKLGNLSNSVRPTPSISFFKANIAREIRHMGF